MRVLVLGATGPSGIQICRYALQGGHVLAVYARNTSKLPNDIAKHDDVQVIQGELTDHTTLQSALDGCDAVLSALGPVEFRHKDTVIANAYTAVIDGMRAKGVKRLIALGTLSILDPRDSRGFIAWLILWIVKTFASNPYKDVVATGNVIEAADDIDWTIVRVPILTNRSGDNTVGGYIGDGKVGWMLNRAGYGRFMVEELEKREWVKQRPMLSSV